MKINLGKSVIVTDPSYDKIIMNKYKTYGKQKTD